MTDEELKKYEYIKERLKQISTPTGISYSGDETISKEDAEWLINYIERQQNRITDLSNRIMQAIYHIEDTCIAKNEDGTKREIASVSDLEELEDILGEKYIYD